MNSMITLREKEFKYSPTKVQVPEEFIYQYDFDENGLLYFLSTFGKTKKWINPHISGQIEVFASSIGAGKLEDIVGREVTNCRTQNEQFSFFGIDLGPTRYFVPTCYSIRNRNSSTYIKKACLVILAI